MFDAIWTAAIALNRTKLQLDDEGLSFMNFSYDIDDEIGRHISDIIYLEALKVNFFGLTVSINSNIAMVGRLNSVASYCCANNDTIKFSLVVCKCSTVNKQKSNNYYVKVLVYIPY